MKSTKKQQIVPELKKVQRVSNNKNLSSKNDYLFDKDSDYNCWGFTAFAFNWLPILTWFEKEEMNYCLFKFTKPVKKPQVGDILVMRDCDQLIHTAIMTDIKEKTLLHKPGYYRLEVNTVKGAKKWYDKTTDIEYRRAKKNKKFNYDKFNKSEFSYSFD